MGEKLTEYIMPDFDAILAEDLRLYLEESIVCKSITSHLLDDMSIKMAQMAWEWKEELDEDANQSRGDY